MKILFTTDTIQRGGKERQLFILSTYLIRKGYDVHIITLKYSDNNYLNEYDFNRTRIGIIDKGNKLQKFCRFKRTIKSFHPDIVFSWDFQTSLFNLLLYQKYGYKFINGSIQHGIRLFRISHFLRSIVCWCSPFVVANSSAGLMANNINPGKNHFVLNNGIESKFENNLPQGEKEERKKRIIPGYKSIPGIIFISIANLVPYKDYFTVLTALKSIKEEYNFYYFIIGDGSLKNKIETRINKFGLSKNVILTGKIFNVEDYIKISDIMIHSSRGEGISNAILESMYAGLPIIASKVGGIPETVFPKSSMLFPYKDYKVLYNCLSKVPQAFNNFNPQSSEYKDHLGKFSVNTMVNKFEEIVSSIKTQS